MPVMKEYATALFEIAAENKREKEFSLALSLISESLAAEPEFVSLLCSSSVPKAGRTASLEAAFEGRVPEEVLSLILLLCERLRMNEFETLRAEYEKLYFESQGISLAKIVSAMPLSEERRQEIISKLEEMSGHKVRAEFETDPSLIGGLTVRLDDTLIDASLKSRLREMKEAIDR